MRLHALSLTLSPRREFFLHHLIRSSTLHTSIGVLLHICQQFTTVRPIILRSLFFWWYGLAAILRLFTDPVASWHLSFPTTSEKEWGSRQYVYCIQRALLIYIGLLTYTTIFIILLSEHSLWDTGWTNDIYNHSPSFRIVAHKFHSHVFYSDGLGEDYQVLPCVHLGSLRFVSVDLPTGVIFHLHQDLYDSRSAEL